MATTGKDRMFSSTDIQFLLTFVAGMAGFWLSGHLPSYLHLVIVLHSSLVTYALNLSIAALIYGLFMVIWTGIILGRRRALKPVLVAAILATVLGLVSSFALAWAGAHHLNISFALLAFILYLAYGIYYVIGWTVARRLAN
jgi:ACR3 family arsenite efflux pump ArsB